MSAMKIRVKCLKELQDKYGRITADKLVEEARDRRYPLHKNFPWDDKKAAHERRLDIARQIIASTRIVVTHSTKKVSVVGYVRDPSASSNEQGYVSVAVLRTEREAAEEALMAEVTRVASMLERARELAVALDLEEELEEALAGALALKSRLRRGPSVNEDRPSA